MKADQITSPHYTVLEDLQGLFLSTVQCALGIHVLRAAGLVTGGTAGLALLLSYWGGWGFGPVFSLVNLPFYFFAYFKRGFAFTLKSFVTVTAVSLLADALPPLLPLGAVPAWVSAILFGVVAGVGLLGLFRHSASLGGVSIVAVILQDWLGIRAGLVLLGWDLSLFALSLLVLAPPLVVWSLLGALILNFVIAVNHRRDWYVVS